MIIEESSYKNVFNRINVKLEDCELAPAELLQKAREQSDLRVKLCDLINPVADHITEDNYNNDRIFFDNCERVLLEISALAPAYDVVLSLIDIAEESDSVRFAVIVSCFEACVTRFEDPLNPVCWCCNTIIRHINEAELPKDCNLEDEERIVADCDLFYLLLKRVYERVMTFCAVTLRLSSPAGLTEQFKDAMVQFLLKLLGRPMAHMDLEIVNDTKSCFRLYAEKIILFLEGHGLIDPLSLVEYVDPKKKLDSSDEVVDEEFNCTSMGTFYYLVLVEGLMEIPAVYRPEWVFEKLLPMALQLMCTSYSTVQRKGLLLVEQSMKNVQRLDVVEHKFHAQLVESLAGVMVYSEVKDNRQTAVRALRQYVRCLEPRRRYALLLNVVSRVEHPGFLGLVCTLVKDCLNEAPDEHLSGKRLSDLVQRLCELSRGPETDLIQASDRIISSLNLLRYLVLSKSHSVERMLPWISSHLSTLQRGLTLSRAHYQLQVDDSHRLPSTAPVTVTVSGETLPEMTQEQKMQILCNALNTLDLIDSLLNRVSECIAQTQDQPVLLS